MTHQRGSALPSILFGILAGAAAGFALGLFLKSPGSEATGKDIEANVDPTRKGSLTSEEAPKEIEAAGAVIPPVDVDREIDEPPPVPPVAVEEDGPFGPAYQKWSDRDLRRGWAETRGDTMSNSLLVEGQTESHQTILVVPHAVGRRLAEEATRRETMALAREQGDWVSVLHQSQGRTLQPILDIVGSKRYPSNFLPRVQGPTMDASQLRANRDKIADGTTIRFPAGVHRLDPGDLERTSPYPKDLTIRGAGMENTLLVLSSDIGSRTDVRNLTIRDCTINTGGYLFDIRASTKLTFRGERLRVVGFDKGAGASCVFGTAGTAVYLVDCRIEGGYGRSPGSGRLFSTRGDALFARFDACRFSRIELGRFKEGSTLLFSGCTFEEMLQDPGEIAEQSESVRLDASPVTLVDPDKRDRGSLSRDLNDLFPNWEEHLR